MADSSLREVLDKLTSLERELSAVKLDRQSLHDTVDNILQTLKRAEFPRVQELRFPEYDGTVDPGIWIHRCELFFRLQRTEDDDKVWLAAFHLTGKALAWYYSNDRSGWIFHTWPMLAEAVRRHFGAQTRG